LQNRHESAAELPAALLNGPPELLTEFREHFTEAGMRRQLLRTRKRLIAVDDPEVRELIAEDVLGVRDVLADFQKPLLAGETATR